MPSIKDVARKAGVSITTVSLVLNNKGNISPETRERVMDVVREMDYTRSIHARNLRDNESRVIGFAQSYKRTSLNPVLDQFLYEMVKRLEAAKRHILLFTVDQDSSTDEYRSLIDSRRVDGFVLSFTEQNDNRFAFLYEADVPFVAFGRSFSYLDDLTHWVDVDGASGVHQATEHLIAYGHRRIGFIAWPEGSASGDSRYHGYREALQAHGIAYEPHLTVRTTDSVTSGYAAAQSLLELPDAPTAIIAASDTLAAGAVHCMIGMGRRVAITGFDNTPIAEFMYPALTSIQQPIEAVAEITVAMLLAQLEGRDITQKSHLLEPELIVRASSTLDY